VGIYLFGQEKGGVGKTSLAANIAAMRTLAGQEVLFVDTDRQESASIWAAARFEYAKARPVTCIKKTGRLGRDIAELGMKYETVIIDAGGRDAQELRQSMAICDRMIIPIRPSQFDTWALTKMAQLVHEIQDMTGDKINASVLLNAVPTNPSIREAEEMRTALEGYADLFPTLPFQIMERIAFRRSARDGLSVVELTGRDRDPKANEEMGKLYEEIFNEAYAFAAQDDAA
jgi:chromosome partitioning protein